VVKNYYPKPKTKEVANAQVISDETGTAREGLRKMAWDDSDEEEEAVGKL
jgi:hypothetical protein